MIARTSSATRCASLCGGTRGTGGVRGPRACVRLERVERESTKGQGVRDRAGLETNARTKRAESRGVGEWPRWGRPRARGHASHRMHAARTSAQQRGGGERVRRAVRAGRASRWAAPPPSSPELTSGLASSPLPPSSDPDAAPSPPLPSPGAAGGAAMEESATAVSDGAGLRSSLSHERTRQGGRRRQGWRSTCARVRGDQSRHASGHSCFPRPCFPRPCLRRFASRPPPPLRCAYSGPPVCPPGPNPPRPARLKPALGPRLRCRRRQASSPHASTCPQAAAAP